MIFEILHCNDKFGYISTQTLAKASVAASSALSLYFHLAELLQFPAEPERREEGVLAGECNQRGA